MPKTDKELTVEANMHLVATCNDVYIVYDYDNQGRRRIRGLKAMCGSGIIPLRHSQEFADTLLKVIADCDKYNATLKT